MELKKAEIEDLNTVVKLKMDMFTEVGSADLLQDNAEEKIYEKYKELYQEEKGCHYLLYENSLKIMEELLHWLKFKDVHTVKLKPSAIGKHLYEKLGFCDSGEMELWM